MSQIGMRFTKKRTALLVALALSCVFTLIARFLLGGIVDSIIETQVKKNLALKNGTQVFKNWVNPPVPVAFRIYVFDVVNHREVATDSAVPMVVEKGPYVYSMHLHKTDVKFHGNDTVEYRQPEMFVYDREASVGPETDTFTSINVPFLAIAHMMQNQSSIEQGIIDAMFEAQGDGSFVTKSVYDIWWGYEDKVMKEMADIFKELHINRSMPSVFGFYMDKNNTDDGLYNVFSGSNGDLSNYEYIDHWNGERKLSTWNSDYANRIYGTDGSVQPPPIKSHANFSIFDGNMFRSLNLLYQKATSVSGIDTFRFVVPFSDFASAKDNPNNAGFCTPDPSHCLPSGAINMSVTSQSLPMVISLPHFVGGDPYYQRQVRGLSPSPEKHQTYYDYHTVTGVALKSSRRYQISLKIEPYKYFPAFHKMPVAYLPVLWIDAVATMDKDTLRLFKTKIQDTLNAMVYVKAALVALTCLQGLVAIVLIIYWRHKDQKELERDSERNLLLKSEDEECNASDNDIDEVMGTSEQRRVINAGPRDITSGDSSEPEATHPKPKEV